MSTVQPYVAPQYNKSSFNCPFCHAYASIAWGNIQQAGAGWIENWMGAKCSHCNKTSIWVEERMVYPVDVSVDPPNPDLPQEIQDDYIEAAEIMQRSPRGAAGLLRLAIQKLVDNLVPGRDNLNAKIGTLVKQGLNAGVQRSLDAVRVIGNEAVHPGQIDLRDNPETAQQLFRLINIIAQRMISDPKEVDAIYQSLPETKRAEIEKRDQKNSTQ